MIIVPGGYPTVQSPTKHLCVICKQEFREKPDTVIIHWNRKYCSPFCARKSRKTNCDNKLETWRCEQCNSLVKGNFFARKRKYCTEKCYEHYAHANAPLKQKPIKHKVEVIQEGIFKGGKK